MSAVLEVSHLRKAFGGVHAVDDVSFSVDAGELVALIGPNGAGKTTCFNCINGQLRPDGGAVTLEGARIDGLAPEAIARKGVGRTFQVAATFASMTVRENAMVALRAHGLPDGVMRLGNKHHPLPPADRRRNRVIAKLRGRIEGVFGEMKRSFGLSRTRYLGLAKVKLECALAVFAFNLKTFALAPKTT